MNSLTIHDLLAMGLRLTPRQVDGIEYPDDFVCWMTMWALPDPKGFAGFEQIEWALPDEETGSLGTVWWPRLLEPARLEYIPEIERDLDDEMSPEWRRFPSRIGFRDHLLCAYWGGCSEEEPSTIATWAALPLTRTEAIGVENAIYTTFGNGLWQPLVELYAFEENQGRSVAEMEEIATSPIPDMNEQLRLAAVERQESVIEALQQLQEIRGYLGINEHPDELQLTRQSQEVPLPDDLLMLWTELKHGNAAAQRQLGEMFPEEIRIIRGSSELW